MFCANYFAVRYFSPWYFSEGVTFVIDYAAEAAQVFTPGMIEGAGQVR